MDSVEALHKIPPLHHGREKYWIRQPAAACLLAAWKSRGQYDHQHGTQCNNGSLMPRRAKRNAVRALPIVRGPPGGVARTP